MKKSNIYILLVVVIVVILLIIFSTSKPEGEEVAMEEVTNELGEGEIVEEIEDEKIVEEMEKISPEGNVDLIMEVSKEGFKPNKFKVTKGITFNWHLINTDGESPSYGYGLKFEDTLPNNTGTLGVEAGKGKKNIQAFVVPQKTGEYSFYEITNPELRGIMYVVE